MKTTNTRDPESVAAAFSIAGRLSGIERFGSGLINDTYLCEYREEAGARRYILQRLNSAVFKRPDQVMENISIVTDHIRRKLGSRGSGEAIIVPALVPAADGRSYCRDAAGDYWRMFPFIEAGEVFDEIIDTRHAYEVGRALGGFQALLADLPASMLHDTLPGFHHTPRYLEEYDKALRHEDHRRAAGLAAEISFVERRRRLAPLLVDLMHAAEIPVRVVHNDPKVNNVMLDRKTRKALCMLDLDTVKPGIVLFDFGDCVRSAANPAGEDAPDLNEVRVDTELFRSVTRGYLHEASSFLTKKEIEMLPLSVQVITFELGIRFLADYLRGDTYFRIKYPEHNLHRARVQFRLLEQLEEAGLESLM